MKQGPVVGELFVANVHSEKYQSGNPIARRLVHGFMTAILELVEETGQKDVHEVGCGEGHISGMLARNGYQVRGSDIEPAALEVARTESARHGLNILFEMKSIYDLDPSKDSADVVLCCEVLEHLTDPASALDRLLSITRRDLIVSVPREPIWHLLNMTRGKYLHALGNTPGHYQHWTRSMFIDFVAKRSEIVSVRSPLPWTAIRCRPHGAASI
jgi:2-polyprenyl-3-methyl-5-hydroxy-6-metoxy-1,4-benzoquinol methylase